MRSQIVTAAATQESYRRSLPWAFTEHGVAMLSSILNTDRAIDVSISVVKAYTSLKQQNEKYPDLENKINLLTLNLDELKNEFQSNLIELKNNSKFLLDAVEKISNSPPQISILTEKEKSTQHNLKQKNDMTKVVQIQKNVAQYYALNVENLTKTSRSKIVVLPRQISIYLIRELAKLTFKDIGILFGRRDRSSRLAVKV